MAYPSEGTLTTDKREVSVSKSWETQTDWESYQSKNNVEIENGRLTLADLADVIGIYVDDFQDGKLTNRDDYDTTSLSPSSLNPLSTYAAAVRPEWTTVNGSPTVSTGSVNLSAGSSNDEIRTTLSESVATFEFTHELNGSNILAEMWMFSDTPNDPSSGSGYFMRNDTDGGVDLFKRTNGSASNLISGPGTQTDEVTISCTVDSDGNFQLFVDGNSEGTATDTDYLDMPEIVLVSGRSDDFDVYSVRVF